MKPMLPTLSSSIPTGDNWVYEVKYDGFRAILSIQAHFIRLISRSGKDLSGQFPEIIAFLTERLEELRPYIPLTLDGELVSLASPIKADFEHIQVRGRMKLQEKIKQDAGNRPCQFLAFDLLTINGNEISQKGFDERKSALRELMINLKFPLEISPSKHHLIQYVPSSNDSDRLWKAVKEDDGEGVVAKKRNSSWESGARSRNWLKIKNYKHGCFFITSYDKKNGYFKAAVYKNQKIEHIGVFAHGISSEEKAALLTIMKQNKITETVSEISMNPAICVELKYIGIYKGQLREPSFVSFRFDVGSEECTWEKLHIQTIPIHEEVKITHPEKPLWKNPAINKEVFIHYLLKTSPLFLPFLKNKVLTVIRYPHGVIEGEAFYQKNCPEYAPSFIQTHMEEGINYIVCNDLSTLTWLGNQLAIEYHLPFQTIASSKPSEIVFDLDPPSRDHFPLAIKAALEFKKLFEQFHIKAFPKLSGNKGIQLHIPLKGDRLTYEDTRKFTEFMATYLVSAHPEDFTVERLKRNRGNKLYLDYLQHAQGKTIIAPYSPRGVKGATVAAPLYWEEVNKELSPTHFTIPLMNKRIEKSECPFHTYFTDPQDEKIQAILAFLEKQ
ncbi:DNA ligase D [Metabacillus arenae]|uniref:DNA ligase (ATP) n=1 Tax=Metabacillus arenae TaxID=2771434 RepID=A0A926NHX6_9BACI|nr:DNA ligase D [Metabacillus arenae]MBD1380333.1 DNA ligase D [Metabacillus arenae]